MKALITFLFFGFVTSSIAQIQAGQPDDLVLCDVNNPGDRTEVFDLTQTETVIINGNSNVIVTYHLTSGAALSNINPIQNPESYTNIGSPEPIWARLQSTAGQGWNVVSFSLIVPYIAEIQNTPENLFEADPDGDGTTNFDLTQNEDLVLGNQDPFDYVFSYYTTLQDAQLSENAIANPENYSNIANPQQIFSRADYFILGCEATIFSFFIATEGTLSTQNQIENSFKIFPNPSSNYLNIKNLNIWPSKLTIQDISGSILNSLSLMDHNNRLSVAHLPKGVYFITIENSLGVQTQKFIKR